MRLPLHEAMREAMRDAPPAGESARENRAFRRYSVSLPVLACPLLPEGGRGQWTRRSTVLVTDISLSGLTFLSPNSYLPGSRLEVQIALGAQTYCVEAIVRRGQFIALPGRRAWQCSVQLLRGEEAARFVPRLARYLYAQGARE